MTTSADIPKILGDAIQCHRAGRLPEAERLYREILTLNPQHADALHLLGMIGHSAGRLDDAALLIRQAIAINGNAFAYYNSLGNVLKDAGKDDEAMAEYQKAIALNPNFADAYYNLGTVLQKQNLFAEAAAAYSCALAANPRLAVAHNNLGVVLRTLGKLDEALQAFEHAAAADPNLAEAHYGRGNVLKDQGLFDQAAEAYERAVALRPEFPDAYNNLGVLLRGQGKLAESLKLFDHAIARDPNDVEAHLNKAMMEILTGNYAEGWRDYEWRLRLPGFVPDNTVPLWDGSNLQGKTILLRSEQGFGDNLQFIRYASLVKQRGGQVWITCPRPLARLFETMQGIDRIFPEGSIIPPHDYQCYLLSLPHHFKTTLDTVPQAIPYLAATKDETAQWAARLQPYSGLKVGLVWAGNSRMNDPTSRAIDKRRSVTLDQMAPLTNIQGIHLVSLQKGDPAKQAPARPTLIDFMDEVQDFAGTAALIANLDLVIGVDTAVIHLAGALGKPVWVLSRFDGCWRWLTDRDDSPWYPKLRLFRQPAVGDWTSVIERITAELKNQID